jgi:hypothetical protein
MKYVGGMREDSTEALAMGGGLAEAHEFGLEAGLAEYHARRPEADPVFSDPALDRRDAAIGVAIIAAAFHGYCTRYAVPDAQQNLQREVPYLVHVDGATRFLQVRVDGVGDEYLVEDKLRAASSMREDALTNERMHGRQLTAETYAVWRETGELRPVKLRCMKKPDPRALRAAWADGGEDAVTQVVVDHFDKGASWVELLAERTTDQMLAFEDELRDISARIDDLDHPEYPRGIRNTDACRAYGRACPALELCHGRGA